MSETPRLRRRSRVASLAACALALLVAPAAAAAAGTVVVADPAADAITALDGTLVWVSGKFGHQLLMRRTPAGVVARVKRAPSAKAYRSIDLGHDRKGRLALTYQRCSSASNCKPFLDNLAGERRSYRTLALKRCSVSTAPAVWGTRLAYGLTCLKPNRQTDDKRSGVYVKAGRKSARRLRLPNGAVRFGISDITAVDLRGTNVAAVAADVYEYAFTQTVRGSGLRSLLLAASEGDSDEHIRGLALGAGGVMWALVNSEHTGDPNQAIIFRVSATCYERERLVNPAGPAQQDGFLAADLAVDATALYLLVPGTGIVSQTFAPEAACSPL